MIHNPISLNRISIRPLKMNMHFHARQTGYRISVKRRDDTTDKMNLNELELELSPQLPIQYF